MAANTGLPYQEVGANTEQQHFDKAVTSHNEDGFGESDRFNDDNESDSMIQSLQSIQTLGDIKAEELRINELGVFDVHLDNLQPSTKQNDVRSVSFDHVKDLENSFIENRMSQLTLLVGMVLGGVVDCNSFLTPGGTKVEVIGGNHTVCALKRIFSRGMCPPTVKVRIYKYLSQVNALAVGLRHNLVHERTRPMTFIEMVKIIRQLRCGDNMTSAQTKEWKRTIQSLFGDKTMKQLEGRLQNHIALARCTDPVFEGILRAQEECGIEFSQTFFKQMMHFPSHYQQMCVDILCRDGIKSYRQNVKRVLSHFLNKKRANHKCAGQTETLNEQLAFGEIDDVHDNDALQEITEMETTTEDIDQLKWELSEAKEAIKDFEKQKEEITRLKAELIDETKKRKHEAVDLIETGAPVMARWSDGILYPARVEKVETYFHVVFEEDGIKKHLKKDDIIVD